ncbi:MAG: cbb3-type cytochrome c oxidase subunit 3 [Calditrichaeota bacterium]|nr:cbb3-type cytochrome c oxidase subunit 3 [Calditrichota bacterium]
MIRDVMGNAGEAIWSIVALIIMFVSFAAILFWTFSGRKNRFEHEMNLPLEDDEVSGDHHHSVKG